MVVGSISIQNAYMRWNPHSSLGIMLCCHIATFKRDEYDTIKKVYFDLVVITNILRLMRHHTQICFLLHFSHLDIRDKIYFSNQIPAILSHHHYHNQLIYPNIPPRYEVAEYPCPYPL